MRVELIMVGKTVGKLYIQAIADYMDRIGHYLPFESIVIPELKAKSLSKEQQKEKEGELILQQIQPSDMVVLLDERGKCYRSIEFAQFLQKQNAMVRRLVFVIGGAYGFSPAVYARAQHQIALSAMTFSHQMVRLFFIEQLYRACTIIKGEPYHHE